MKKDDIIMMIVIIAIIVLFFAGLFTYVIYIERDTYDNECLREKAIDYCNSINMKFRNLYNIKLTPDFSCKSLRKKENLLIWVMMKMLIIIVKNVEGR